MLSGKNLGSKDVYAYNFVKGLCRLLANENTCNCMIICHLVIGYQNDSKTML